MADISQYLQAIMAAVYGEDVRGSIHDAIALINDVGEAVLTLGTAVDSPTSPTTGFYQDSVYLNTSTGDMWTCTGTGWSLSGNTKGDKGDPGDAATINVGTVTSGAVASVTNSGTTSAAVFDFVLPQGDKGDTGDGLTAESEHSGSNTIVSIKNTTTQTVVDTFNVPDGVPGATGNGIASIAKTATAGLVDTYTITYTDGTSTTFTVTNGQDGQGAGDMTKVAYDPTNAVADAGGIPAYVSAHAGTTYTGEKGVIVAGTTIKAALVNDTASSLASQTISATQNRQYAVNLDNNSKLSVNVPWENTTYSPATTSANGLMSSTDKNKLDGLDAVVANPAGSPTDDLTSIQIGSTVYRLQGGGGTTIVQIPSVSGTSFVYDGTAQGAAITGLDTTHCTVVPGTGTTVTTVGSTTYVKATNAGSYDFTIELNDPDTMVWSDLTVADKTYAFAITKAPQTITASKNSVSLTAAQPSDTVTISGQQTSLNATSSDTGIATASESSGVVTITGVGTGTATISVYAEESANYAQSNTVSITADAVINITKTITVYSAANDTVSFSDRTGSKTVTTNSSGSGTVSITYQGGDSITFTSSVAKKIDDQSQAYSKAITLLDSTTEVNVMPDGAVYWYGCYKKPMSVYASATSGSSGTRVSPTLTNSTNYFTCSMSPSDYCTGSMFTSNAVSLSGYNAIKYVVRTASATATGGYGGFIAAMLANSTSDNYTALATSNIVNNETKSNTVFSQSLSGVSANTGYVGFRLGSASAASISISAIVLE